MTLPDLAELIALRGVAHGLDLRAHRPAMARLYGSHRSAQRGRGLEFEEVRPYIAGDDVRNIDWRVTARRGKPHTKLFREERERPVWLILDLHDGLFFGSKRQLKSALLLRAAALLGWVAVQGGDRLGAVIARPDASPLIYPARSREAGVLPMLQALVELQPTAPRLPQSTTLDTLLSAARPMLQSGSLVLILSDFSTLNASAENALGALASQHDCRLLWLTDPLEHDGLPEGSYQVGIPGRRWWLDGRRSQQPWHAAWQRRKQTLQALSQRLNLPLTRLDTATAVSDSLPALLREPLWLA